MRPRSVRLPASSGPATSISPSTSAFSRRTNASTSPATSVAFAPTDLSENDGMKQPPNESIKSHPIRVAAVMLAGTVVGALLCPAVGNLYDPWFRVAPLVYMPGGAIVGLLLELLTRIGNPR